MRGHPKKKVYEGRRLKSKKMKTQSELSRSVKKIGGQITLQSKKEVAVKRIYVMETGSLFPGFYLYCTVVRLRTDMDRPLMYHPTRMAPRVRVIGKVGDSAHEQDRATVHVHVHGDIACIASAQA